MRHRQLHDAGGFDDLGQKHFARAKQIANHIHAVHQRAFNHMQRPAAFGQNPLVGFFRVFGDEFGDAMHQRVREALVHIAAAPFQPFAVVFGGAFGVFGNF